jgi:UDP-2,4-diacetamido-2,4,6-trideoxy-beta-L-altropyranose hydrolase
MNKNTVLIRCDASARVGYGHLVRCLALAEAMRDSGRWEIVFAIAEDQGGVEAARARGFCVEKLHDTSDANAEVRWISLLVERHQCQLLVTDVRTQLSASALQSIRFSGVKVAVIDDISERRLSADIAFYPPIPQIAELDWSNFEGQLNVGWEWILMPPLFAAERTKQELMTQTVATIDNERTVPRLLVTMGGSDPAGLTITVLEAIDAMSEEFEVTLVIGKAFAHANPLKALLASARRHYHVLHNPPSMATVMADADLAIASFGATAYELAAMGVPAIHLCLTDDHAQSASALATADASVNLGVYSNVNHIQIQGALRDWLQDPESRKAVGQTARALIDGHGVSRVVQSLETLLENIHAVHA